MNMASRARERGGEVVWCDAVGRYAGSVRRAQGAPHDLVLALLLLPLAHHDAFDDRALLGREVREVRHVGHGGRRPPRAACGAPARRVLRCCARGAYHAAPLRPEVYLIMPDGPMARSRLLTSARLLIGDAARTSAARPRRRPPDRAAAGSPAPHRCVRIACVAAVPSTSTHYTRAALTNVKRKAERKHFLYIFLCSTYIGKQLFTIIHTFKNQTEVTRIYVFHLSFLQS